MFIMRKGGDENAEETRRSQTWPQKVGDLATVQGRGSSSLALDI